MVEPSFSDAKVATDQEIGLHIMAIPETTCEIKAK